jgi:lipoic acid synthetase
MGNGDKIGERRRRLPDWFRMERAKGETYSKVKNLVNKNHLHTICTSGNCPNIGECWNAGTATFMILGDICTRSCKFCSVKTGKPLPVDKNEPRRLANAIRIMKIKHAVLTSVDRDDLDDGGSGFWAEVIITIKEINPEVTMETLIPDFDGEESFLMNIIQAAPEVISHNLETVRRLTPQIRSRAKYDRSLKVLKFLTEKGCITKSGLMLGLGENEEEVLEAMDDLRQAGCKILTLGQYLAPTLEHIAVQEYIPPEKFEFYRLAALGKGFTHVESSPLVRSSYHAEKHVNS